MTKAKPPAARTRWSSRRLLVLIVSCVAIAVAVATSLALESPGTVALPAPSSLSIVSCTSPLSCFASGWRVEHNQVSRVLARLSSNSLATIRPGPLFDYETIACVRTDWCMVLGYASLRAMAHAVVAAEIYREGHWTEIAGPKIGQGFSLACASERSCIVASKFVVGTSPDGDVAWWNGSRWRIIKPIAGRFVATYLGSSCAARHWCMVIGQRAPSPSAIATPLTAIWDGSTLRPIPLPGDSDQFTGLVAVSCGSPTSCLAIGLAEGGPKIPTQGYGGVVYRWNGRHWLLVPVLLAAGDLSLQSVSCADAMHCVIVGVDTRRGVERLVAYQLAGSIWSAIPPVTKSPWNLEGQGGLVSIDCANLESCVAVGPVQIAGLQAALVERWNGRSWSAMLGTARQRPLDLRRNLG